MWRINSNYGSVHFWNELEKELLSLIEGESNLIANLANISSWIHHSIPDLNWSGFYLWDKEKEELVLGPFQGRPACLRIKPERGVCGSAYTKQKTLRVDDVHMFPGHIACDSASRSELVIPFAWGVLDLDSPSIARFSEDDDRELTRIMSVLDKKLFKSN